MRELGLGPVNDAFPGHCFPTGAVHEFICSSPEDISASGGFIAGLLAALMQTDGVCCWISIKRKIFPPALRSFGIQPDRIIFIDLPDERQLLWVMEETLKCNGLSAVVAEIKDLDFTSSRRLQLAVEQSHVTGFILRTDPRRLHTTACLTRWKINSTHSIQEQGLPGVGFPQWNIILLKVRNGKPGQWKLGWKAGRFIPMLPLPGYNSDEQLKTG